MVNPVRATKPEVDLLVLRIELKNIEPTIWRRVAVPENITLGRLHLVIQIAMGWENGHLHEFEIAGEHYGTPDRDGWGPQVKPEARKTLIKALAGKKAFRYVYDFGDSWDHRIKVEKRLPAIACEQLPFCVDGANACPPEDVGGAWGYADFLEAMANTEHPEHEAMMEWYGEPFNPTAFDREQVNEWLKSVGRRA
ncbi:plasmid pRiA4b ORF-3 family protein [Pseudomonas monteilii]|uniref:Plasmid pRiA4b ORF-3 family protein n=1 Tax=Pseudomonas monteilii TaxID=76759 RepID=A0A399LZA2_9PSED|nr:plasmid pRiA4b ORF-3 family protein [Pseudomonas monteilii]RII74873.1 plasmid pRiA4b ORF-3 family protein [Pseudomonas monteilii]